MNETKQMKWYKENTARANAASYMYRKRLMAIGKYAIEKKLLTKKELSNLESFIFGKQNTTVNKNG